MKKHKMLSLFVVCLIAFSSCADILNEEPKSTVKDENAIENLKDAQTALYGTYSLMRDYWSTGAIALGDVMTDEVFAAQEYTTHKLMQSYAYSSSDTEVRDLWLQLYSAINSANNILFKIDNLPGSNATRNDIKGQALVLRAVAYMELCKWFAKPYTVDSTAAGVPIKQTTSSDEQPARASVKDVYKYIETDLLDADKLLAGKTSVLTVDIVYTSTWAVKGFLARFYLYKGDYVNAIAYASKIIDGNRFVFCNTAQTISSMWANDEGSEIIFMLGYTPTNLGGRLANDYYVLRDDPKYKPTAYYVPSTQFLDLYGIFGTANTNKTADDDLRYQEGVYFTTSATIKGWTAMLCYKYPGNPSFVEKDIINVNMPKILRLPEIYLIRAEAYAYLNNDVKALADYNIIRKNRIFNYYNEINLSGNRLKTEIFNERLRELCFEGHYWFDLKRMQKGFVRIPTEEEESYIDISASHLSVQADSYRWLLPIPNDEIKGNPSIEKNPGY